MKLIMIDCVVGGRCGALLSSGDALLLERAAQPGTTEIWLPPTLRGILQAGDEGLDLARRIVNRVEQAGDAERERLREAGALLPLASVRLLPPIADPALFLSCGHAYRSHVAEMKSHAPSTPQGFLKAAATIVGPNADVALPSQCADKVDFEGEICVVLGRACHNVSVGEAQRCIAGYTITNDVSARNWVDEVNKAKTTAEARTAWDLNHMGKQLPEFSPLGSALVTVDEVADPARLHLTTRLNGQVMQDAVMSDLIFTAAESISFFSRWYAFQPGDILSTGTPAGVGFGRKPQVFVKAGDVVEVEVSGIGKLANRFVTAPSRKF